MLEKIENVLHEVVRGVPGAYLQFKKSLLNLPGAYSAKQFVTFLSNQPSLNSCDPEALVDMGFYIAESEWILCDVSLYNNMPEACNGKFNADNFVAILKSAAFSNPGAQCALIHILINLEIIAQVRALPFNLDADLNAVINCLRSAQTRSSSNKSAYGFYDYCEALICAAGLEGASDKERSNQLLAHSQLPAALCLLARNKSIDGCSIYDIELAESYLCRAAQEPGLHPYAAFKIAWNLFKCNTNTQGLPLSTENLKNMRALGFDYFQQAALLGYSEAQYYLGYCFQYGMSIQKNDTKALIWYHQAAQQGYADALFILGKIYEQGWCGVKKNILLAIQYYHIATGYPAWYQIVIGTIALLSQESAYQEIPVNVSSIINKLVNANPALEYMLLAAKEIEHLDEDDAIHQYIKVIKLHPDSIPAYMALIQFRLRMTGKKKNDSLIIEELIQLGKLIIDDDKNHNKFMEICFNIDAMIRSNKLIMKDEVLCAFYTLMITHEFNPALTKDKLYEYYLNRGNGYLRCSEYLQAIKDYTTYIVKYNGNNSDVYRFRATAYKLKGSHNAALDDWQRANVIDQTVRKAVNDNNNNEARKKGAKSSNLTTELKPPSSNETILSTANARDDNVFSFVTNTVADTAVSINRNIAEAEQAEEVDWENDVIVEQLQTTQVIEEDTVVLEKQAGVAIQNQELVSSQDLLSLSLHMENMLSRIASLFQHLTRVENIISENLTANCEIIAKIDHLVSTSEKKNKSNAAQNIFDLVKKLTALRDKISLEIGEDIAELSKNKPDVPALQLQNTGESKSIFKEYMHKVEVREKSLVQLQNIVEKSRFSGLLISLNSTITNYKKETKIYVSMSDQHKKMHVKFSRQIQKGKHKQLSKQERQDEKNNDSAPIKVAQQHDIARHSKQNYQDTQALRPPAILALTANSSVFFKPEVMPVIIKSTELEIATQSSNQPSIDIETDKRVSVVSRESDVPTTFEELAVTNHTDETVTQLVVEDFSFFSAVSDSPTITEELSVTNKTNEIDVLRSHENYLIFSNKSPVTITETLSTSYNADEVTTIDTEDQFSFFSIATSSTISEGQAVTNNADIPPERLNVKEYSLFSESGFLSCLLWKTPYIASEKESSSAIASSLNDDEAKHNSIDSRDECINDLKNDIVLSNQKRNSPVCKT